MAGTGLSLTACDVGDGGKPVDALSYTSVAECRTAGKIPADQCETAFDQAQKANDAERAALSATARPARSNMASRNACRATTAASSRRC